MPLGPDLARPDDLSLCSKSSLSTGPTVESWSMFRLNTFASSLLTSLEFFSGSERVTISYCPSHNMLL